MALRNAFEDLLTERTGRLILAATNYARDINDRMRVIVDNTVPVNQTGGPYMNGSTAVTARLWNDPSAVFTIDQREMQRTDSLMAGRQSRQKWSYS